MENPLLELQEYENLQEALKKAKGPVQATGTLDSQKVHLMHWLGKDGGFSWKLVVINCFLITVVEDFLLCVMAAFLAKRIRALAGDMFRK